MRDLTKPINSGNGNGDRSKAILVLLIGILVAVTIIVVVVVLNFSKQPEQPTDHQSFTTGVVETVRPSGSAGVLL